MSKIYGTLGRFSVYFKRRLISSCYNSSSLKSTLSRQQKSKKPRHLQSTIFAWVIPYISKIMIQDKPKLSENDKEIYQIILDAEELLFEKEDFKAARELLQRALLLSKDSDQQVVVKIYEHLATTAIKEGNLIEAESTFIHLIDYLQSIGHTDDHNEVIRVKLKLCRLSQLLGQNEMAELGFKQCLEEQERKIWNSKTTDDNNERTNYIYISCLYWYARFLQETKETERAKNLLEKAFAQLKQPHMLTDRQVMSLFYLAADIRETLQEYDMAIIYFVQAFRMNIATDPTDPKMPLILTKLGKLFFYQKLYEFADYWCTKGQELAERTNNQEAKHEAQNCLEELNKHNFKSSEQKK